jgi:hypothetical protein
VIHADTAELDALARDLAADNDVMDEAANVVSKGSLNIKRGARRRVSGYAYLPHYPNSIGYDIFRGGNLVSSEVGPDKDQRQGPLGTIIENGSVNNAPIPHLSPELDEETPRFLAAVAAMGEATVL